MRNGPTLVSQTWDLGTVGVFKLYGSALGEGDLG